MNLEFFSCSGGMAEGFRRAGIVFDLAFDFAPAHCDSYERNLGHRPIGMDVRDVLRLVEHGWRPPRVDLVVADPPCTPWSRAGKRMGTEDERDMLGTTIELLDLLRPAVWLIGNVPGLDDSDNWERTVKPVIGDRMVRAGYCVDFARLDAADYGVPQHRVRPFWFGHAIGTPCIRWPVPTHTDPEAAAVPTLPGLEALRPWVTCREALGHLSAEDLGRPVGLRRRACNSGQHGSVAERPARVVGTSNLSDGNVLLVSERHAPAHPDAPAPTVGARMRGQAAVTGARNMRVRPASKELTWAPNHPPSSHDAPANVIRAGSGGGAVRALEWPWDRPSTTVLGDPRIPPPGHHGESFLSAPADGAAPNAVLLSERAAAILQGFPEGWHFAGATKTARWSQIGQAMPPALAEAVARSVAAQIAAARTEAA